MLSREGGDLSEVALSRSVPPQLAEALGHRESERPGLFEAPEHREQLRSDEHRQGVRILREDCLERLERLVGRTRADQ